MIFFLSEVNEQQYFCEVNKHIEMYLVRLTDTSNFFRVSLMNSGFLVRFSNT